MLFIHTVLRCGLQLLSACSASAERREDAKASQHAPLFAQISMEVVKNTLNEIFKETHSRVGRAVVPFLKGGSRNNEPDGVLLGLLPTQAPSRVSL